MAERKRSVTVFLGAGASAALGYALTNEIVPLLAQKIRTGFKAKRLVANVERLERLLRVFRPITGDDRQLPSITELLSVIDHCLLHDEALDESLDLASCRRLIERAVAEILDRGTREASTPPAKIVKWFEEQVASGTSVSIISTNYDTSIDLPLLGPIAAHPDRIDLGFAFRQVVSGEIVHPSNQPTLRLYKLHGALNWLRCTRCTHVYVNLHQNVAPLADDDRGRWNECHCGHWPLDMLLVTPSYVRDVRDPNLRSIWQRAYEALRVSDTWMFVGFSLPPEDVAIHTMLLRARLARRDQPKVHVFDPSPNVGARYTAMFPDAVVDARGLAGLLA